MRILGMHLWHERLSDEQYIERVRKGLQTKRRWRYISAVIGLAILLGTVWLVLQSINLLSNINNFSRVTGHGTTIAPQQMVYAVYYIAGGMGFFAGLIFFDAIFHIGHALFDYRKDKLLVECWESLSDAERSRLRQRSS